MDEIYSRIDRFFLGFLEQIAAAYASSSNVENLEAWYHRLDELTLALQRGTATYRQIEDHIFELKVMHYLTTTFPGLGLVYEPQGIDANGRNCDLSGKFADRHYLIEIKSFHPESRQRAVPVEYIAPNNNVVMDDVSYHYYQATRGHLIDVVLATEDKIANFQPGSKTVLAVPDGFYLRAEDLRDFVFIYRNGRPRADDPLGPMTMHNLRKPFSGAISEFWAMPFPQQSFYCTHDRLPKVIGPLARDDRPVAI
jgi:hypothetical protein